MKTDLLTLIAVVLCAIPAFMRSARTLALAVIVDIVFLVVISKAILAVPSFGNAPTEAVVIVLIWFVFLFGCILGGVLLAVRSSRRRKAALLGSDNHTSTRTEAGSGDLSQRP